MNEEKIKLSAKVDPSGVIMLVDQHGRMLDGVYSINISAKWDPVDTNMNKVVVECLLFNENGKPNANNRPRINK